MNLSRILWAIAALLAASIAPARAATVKISDLTIITAPSTNTFLEVADMDAVTKSRKYLLTNLTTVAEFRAATNAIVSASSGTVSNNVASAGLLSVDATKTNGIAATSAHVITALGYTPQAQTAGTVINTGASVANQVPRYTDTTGTNIAPTSVTIINSTNISAGVGTFTNGLTAGVSTFTGSVTISQSGGQFISGISGGFAISGRASIRSSGGGILNFFDNATTDFIRYTAGGITASFPAAAKNSAGWTDVVADNSAPTFRLGTRQVTAKTSDYPLVAASATAALSTDVSKLFTNEGAAAIVNFTLPGAAAGYTYTFVIQDADGITVTAAAGDTIRIAGSVSAAAGNITATAIGNTVTLTAINATEWIALSHEGTWTVN